MVAFRSSLNCLYLLTWITYVLGSAPSCGRIPVHDSSGVESRVIGGHIPEAGNWPWLVQVTHRGYEGKGVYGCTGAFISRRHVLTAAHCAFYGPNGTKDIAVPPEQLFARYGSVYTRKMAKVRVAKKFFHPRSYILGEATQTYHSVVQNDILVLELKRAVRFNETIQPICLPLGFRERVGEIAIFAGFGDKEIWGTEGAPDRSRSPNRTTQREPSPSARENIIPMRKITACPYKSCPDCPCYGCPPNMNRSLVLHAEEFLCVGGRLRGTAPGDSGGPLVVNRKGTHFAVGVVSHGLPLLEPYPHQRFTRVAEHCWWIERDTKGEVKCIEME